MSLEEDNRRPPTLYDDLPNVITLKPFGAENRGDQWDIVHQPETEPMGVAGTGITIINFTNRSVSMFSQYRNGKLLIGVVTKDQQVGS